MTREDEENRKRVSTLYIGLLVQLVFTLYALYVSKEDDIEKILLLTYILCNVGLQVAVAFSLYRLIWMMHVLFCILAIVVVPLFASSKLVLACNIAAMLVALALRSSHGRCTLHALSASLNKSSIEVWISNNIDFDALYSCSGLLCLWRLVYM